MAWTNGRIFHGTSTVENLMDRIAWKDCEIKILQDRLNQRERELANIPEAVREFGYVELSDDTGFKIRLVEAKPAPAAKEGG